MAAAVGTVLWFSVTRTAPRTGAVLLAVILLGAAAFMTGRTEDSPSPLERISSVTGRDSKYASFWSRVETYREAAKRIEENPLVGVGLDEKSSVAGQHAVHNLVIGTWYRAGIAGLIGILVVLMAIARTGWMNLAASRSEEEYLMSAALLSSFAAFVIFMFSAPILFTRYGWVSAALLVALRSAQLAGSHATVAVEAARTSRPRLV
jgi:O-antigen ligase